ncbi:MULTISPECIES: hypothetical protein [Comamonas]|uniref:hypothetical protein n=1 Tax=Comamonas TaxID=283 RepID=UPI0012ADB189|nr:MULTISPECIES: hypothetical protein [Comamonas]MDE1557370.1 hypothetical protein [Comamonas aquatica]MDH0383715.1 hypothetical protein [Comamonas aquatica]MDH0431682.1 hypothetical protein [Comamonas aquatica]MDH0942801.1 hypothetical protein [Comamonas aquatica]MRT18800.1 hypothetical protein [Comamonas sp. CAH-2]
MTLSCIDAKKPKPPVSVKLPNDLEEYLRDQAKVGFRSLSKEITMRLEQSRKAEEAKDEKQA